MERVPEREKQEVREFFEQIGLSEEMQHKATEEIARDKKQWVDFMMKYELGLDKPDPKRATKSALNIGLSYIAGGVVPLSPYFLYKILQVPCRYQLPLPCFACLYLVILKVKLPALRL